MKTKKFIYGILLMFLLFFLFVASEILASIFVRDETLKDTLQAASRYLIAILGLFLANRLYGTDFRFRSKGFAKGVFGTGITLMALVVLNLYDDFSQPEISFVKALPRLIFAFVCNMGTGMFEESMLRGTLFNSFRYRFGESRKGIVKAILISSIVFGLLHFSNLISSPTRVIATISQVIYAIAIGCCLACVYYITDSIWVVSVLHGLIDFTSEFWDCFINSDTGLAVQKATEDITLSEGIYAVSVTVVCAVIAFIQLRREFGKRKMK